MSNGPKGDIELLLQPSSRNDKGGISNLRHDLQATLRLRLSRRNLTVEISKCRTSTTAPQHRGLATTRTGLGKPLTSAWVKKTLQLSPQLWDENAIKLRPGQGLLNQEEEAALNHLRECLHVCQKLDSPFQPAPSSPIPVESVKRRAPVNVMRSRENLASGFVSGTTSERVKIDMPKQKPLDGKRVWEIWVDSDDENTLYEGGNQFVVLRPATWQSLVV